MATGIDTRGLLYLGYSAQHESFAGSLRREIATILSASDIVGNLLLAVLFLTGSLSDQVDRELRTRLAFSSIVSLATARSLLPVCPVERVLESAGPNLS